MQQKIAAYRAQLQASMNALTDKGWALPTTGARSVVTWGVMLDEARTFEAERCVLGLFAGTQFDRGRGIVTDLDAWRDWLATQKTSDGSTVSVPDPMPVPHSDVGLFGGVGTLLAIVAGIFVLRELR
jgi:hypothetical protein